MSEAEAVSAGVLKIVGSLARVGTGLNMLFSVGTMGLAPKEAK